MRDLIDVNRVKRVVNQPTEFSTSRGIMDRDEVAGWYTRVTEWPLTVASVLFLVGAEMAALSEEIRVLRLQLDRVSADDEGHHTT